MCTEFDNVYRNCANHVKKNKNIVMQPTCDRNNYTKFHPRLQWVYYANGKGFSRYVPSFVNTTANIEM